MLQRSYSGVLPSKKYAGPGMARRWETGLQDNSALLGIDAGCVLRPHNWNLMFQKLPVGLGF